MPYINIDIELDEFDTDDLVDELLNRFKAWGRKQFKPEQLNSLKTELDGLYRTLHIDLPSAIGGPRNLEDQMKFDIIQEHWGRFTSWQLEELFKTR